MVVGWASSSSCTCAPTAAVPPVSGRAGVRPAVTGEPSANTPSPPRTWRRAGSAGGRRHACPRPGGPGSGPPSPASIASSAAGWCLARSSCWQGRPASASRPFSSSWCRACRAAGHPCLLASGEESRGQVAAGRARLGLDGAALSFVPGRELDEVRRDRRRGAPARPARGLDPHAPRFGSRVAAGRRRAGAACTDALVGLAKDRGDRRAPRSGHVTKDGDLAGPRTLEHAVDVVLVLRGRAPLGPAHAGRRQEPVRARG